MQGGKNPARAEAGADVEALRLQLKEAHHRIKNHLQILASMMSLQESHSAPALGQVLAESRHRVMALGRLHEHIQAAGARDVVEMAPFLATLCADLARDLHGGNLQFELDVEPAALPGETAMALAFVVNELTTNAMKYAYPSGAGAVRIALRRAGADWRLTVADDGPGLAAEGARKPDGIGMSLIYALANDIGATITIDKPMRGVSITLRFNALGTTASL